MPKPGSCREAGRAAAGGQLQIPPVGRDDKGRVVTFRKIGDLDGQRPGELAAAAVEPLLGRRLQIPPVGRDDKGRVVTFRKIGDLDGQRAWNGCLLRSTVSPMLMQL
jgi:hypothetical protein